MAGSAPKFSQLKVITRDNLVHLLETVPESKDLVIDPQLMRPLDHFAGASFLKEHGVDKIFKLENNRLDVGCNKRIYLLRPELLLTKFVADHINNDKKAGKSRSYKIVFVPKKLCICENLLEQEGVYGDVSIDEFHLEFIPLDEDVLTLGMPSLLKDYFVDGDQTSLSFVAWSLMTLQHLYGTFPCVYGIGKCSKMVGDLLNRITEVEGEYRPIDGPEIGTLILIDRGVDYVTPLCSQVTYAGVVDDTFTISAGFIELGPEVTGKDQKVKQMLSDQDPVFRDIRDRHFSNVFGYLSQEAKAVQSGYDKRQDLSTVSDMKQFVSERLRGLRQQHKSLAIHIGVCESVLKTKTRENFERRLRAEHNMLEHVEDKDDTDYLEQCIIRQVQSLKTLQLMCLLSQTRGGIDVKLYNSLKLQFIQSFGHEHMITFRTLKQIGLFSELDRKGLYKTLSKRFNLIPKDGDKLDLKSPQDMAYVFSGAYTPLSCKLVEQIECGQALVNDIHKQFHVSSVMWFWLRIIQPEESVSLLGMSVFEEVARLLNVDCFSSRMASSARYSNTNDSPGSKCKLVMFLGGCTFSEISALRLLARKLGYHIIIGTTAIVNGTRLLESLSHRP